MPFPLSSFISPFFIFYFFPILGRTTKTPSVTHGQPLPAHTTPTLLPCHLTITDKPGPLARIGTNWVVCSDPNELRRIWGVRSNYKRAYWYRGLRIDPYRDSTFSTLDDAVHDDLR